jgi:nitric oxide reductase subunit B
MAIAALLFFGQTLIGGGVAHYRADPGNFYGIDLARFLPSNLLRAWHLQLAILWIATAYVGGALFVADMLGRREPIGQCGAIHLLFAALLVVVVGSLLGEWVGLLQWLGNAWFWFGNQGWNTSISAVSGKYCSPLASSSGSPCCGEPWRRPGAIRSGAVSSLSS